MNKIIIILILSIISIVGCKTNDYYHDSGGPYYFKSAITYQGIRPNEEITQEETKELEKNGYAFYVAHFNSAGKPTLVEKYYEGKIFAKHELFYGNGKHIKTIITDKNGNQITQYEK